MSSPILDREQELARIDRLMSAVAGGQPRVLLVEGPAGIGKTHLLAELRRRWAAAGRAQLSARGGELQPLVSRLELRVSCSSALWLMKRRDRLP
jgi:predicted ATPase